MSTEVIINNVRTKLWLYNVTEKKTIEGDTHRFTLKSGTQKTVDFEITCSVCKLKAWLCEEKIHTGISDDYDTIELVGKCETCDQ